MYHSLLKAEDVINALDCATRVMDGTAGGYTQEEIAAHKDTLHKFLKELEDSYLDNLKKKG